MSTILARLVPSVCRVLANATVVALGAHVVLRWVRQRMRVKTYSGELLQTPAAMYGSGSTVNACDKNDRERGAIEFWVRRAAFYTVGIEAPPEVLSLIWSCLDQDGSDRKTLSAAILAVKAQCAHQTNQLNLDSGNVPIDSSRRSRLKLAHLISTAAYLEEIKELATDSIWLRANRSLVLRLCRLCTCLTNGCDPEEVKAAAELVLDDAPEG